MSAVAPLSDHHFWRAGRIDRSDLNPVGVEREKVAAVGEDAGEIGVHQRLRHLRRIVRPHADRPQRFGIKGFDYRGRDTDNSSFIGHDLFSLIVQLLRVIAISQVLHVFN